MKTQSTKLRLLLALAGTLATISSLLSVPLLADDRDILRDSSTKPYVFILLDTSGSMNWAPKCTQAQYDTYIDDDGDPATPDVRTCNFVCPTGDCKVPRDGDDPASKFRQAKEGLYEVLQAVTDLNIGFATYNSDNLAVGEKHWMYTVAASQPAGVFSLSGGIPYPVIGSWETFGEGWWNSSQATCAYGTGDANVGCFPRTSTGGAAANNACGSNNNVCAPADIADTWEFERFRRLPRLDVGGNQTTYFYLRVPNGTRYRVKYSGSVTYGNAQISVSVEVAECTNAKCSTVTANPPTKTIRYDRVGDFIGWENNRSRTDPAKSYIGGTYGQGQDSTAGNFCSGWEPNSDTSSDQYVNNVNANIKRRTATTVPLDGNPAPYFVPTGADAGQAWRFQYGDVTPLSWVSQNTLEVLNRLAPRLNGGDPATDPEAFANATYLQDVRSGSESYLRVKNLDQKPLIPTGSTPLYNSIAAFRDWYRGCSNYTDSCTGGTGWDDFAAAHDTNWGCRRKFLLVITDGDETCPTPSATDTCKVGNVTGALRQFDEVKTFVVGYGIDSASSNQLTCMAVNGGTTAPYYPQNKGELVRALKTAFDQIREETAAFASAAVPQVQANATDKIFLSSFTPVKEKGFWAGRMDSFLKPLPVDVDGRPDRSIVCDSTTKASCFLWDAGDVQDGQRGGGGTYNPQGLLLQAPHPDDVDTDAPYDASELQLGTGANERRVVYSQFNEPGNRKLFTYPSTNSQKYDLWTGMGIGFIVGNTASETAADNRANKIITKVLLEKEGDIPDPTDNTLTVPITYLLGDIFHADPLVINKPSSFAYYTTEPYLNKALCGVAADPDRGPKISYRAFADRNVCRRTLLFTAANDGQLHAFDAGIFRDPAVGTAECLLPAKDLDGDGVAETDEFDDGVIDYDTGDAVEDETQDKHIIDGAYDNGTGKEVFSFVPRAMLKPVLTLTEGEDRNKGPWGIDGSPRVDDVFIDPLASEAGATTCVDREWRSVLVGGYREGGPGYYALDITQPDTLDNKHVPQPSAGYTPSCFDGNANCDNHPYPSVLWEFQDKQSVQVSPGIFLDMELDEDLNNERDLGNSWSKMTTGRIRICTGACSAAETEDRFVAVFGGGLGKDPTVGSGNFVYMVDIETGKTIYKKRVIGSVPADVTAVDSNGDSYIDRLYFGTTAGFIYKVQFEHSPLAPMKLASQIFQTRNAGVNYNFTAERLIGPAGDTRRYDPFQVFSSAGRPIYQEITAIYVAKKNRVALAVGTGNRWNLWQNEGWDGRFYVLLDNDNGKASGTFEDTDRDGVLNISCGGCTQPLTEAKYQGIAPGDPNDPATTPNYLYDGNGAGSLPGWYLTLDTDEKVITEAFSLAGITIFTSLVPTEVTNDDGTCSRAGESHIFIVGTVTALGYFIPPGGTLADRQRATSVPRFTTPPFVEQSATKNPEAGGTGADHADYITESLALIRDELKTLQSTRCRYANYTQNIKTIRSDTGLVFVAPIPLCIDPTSWKEF